MALLPESASPPNGVVDFSITKSALPPEDDLEDGEIFDDEDDEPQEFLPVRGTAVQQQEPSVVEASSTKPAPSTGPRRSSSPQSSGGGGGNVGGSNNNGNNNQITHGNALNENCGGFLRSADSRRGPSPLGDRGKGRSRTRRKRPREEERHQTFLRKKRRAEGNDSKALREKNTPEEEEEIFDEPQSLNQHNDWVDRPSRSDEEDEEMGFDERQRGGSSERRRSAGPASRNQTSSSGAQNRTRRSRQRNQNNKKAQRNGRELKSVCKYFLNGHCQRGADCPFSHSTNPLRKFEVCKFYQNDCCAKKDSCVYMHSDYPCRFHHLGLKCYAGKRCKFSHSKVTPYTKQMLIKQNQTEADKHFLQTLPTTSPRRGDSRSPTPDFEYNSSGGNSGRRHPSSHHSNDFQMDVNEDGGDEYDQNDDYQEDFDQLSNDHQLRNQMHHQQQDFRDDQQGPQQQSHHHHHHHQPQQLQQQNHHHHHHDNSMRGVDRERGSDRGSDRNDRGFRGDREGPRNFGRGGRGGGGGRRQNQRNRRRSPDRMSQRHHSQHESKPHPDLNHFDDSGNEEGHTPMPSPTGENLGERDIDEEEGELGFEQPSEVPLEVGFEEDRSPTALQIDIPEPMVVDISQEQSSQQPETKLEPSDEQDIPLNLPKKQRELYLRIQQQQQQRDTHSLKQGDEEDDKETEYKEDDWYSSDDEADSRPLDVILNKIKPKSVPAKPEVSKDEITPSLLDFDVSAVSKILSSVRETIEQKKQSEAEKTTEAQKPPEEARKARDPRLMRARTPPPASRVEMPPALQLPSLMPSRPMTQVSTKQVDVDLRVSRSAADVDLRQLPFKPAPVHQAANEIDASINANPSITYCPRPFTPPAKPDYSHVPIKNPNDPRLRKYIVAGALPSQPLPSVAPIPVLPSFVVGPGAPNVVPQLPIGSGMSMINPTQSQPQRPPPQMTASQTMQPVPRDPRQRALASDPRRKPLLPTPPGPPNLAAMGSNMLPPMGMPVVGMPMNMGPMQQGLVMGHQGQMYGHGHPPPQGGQDSDLRRPPGGPFPLIGDVDLRFQQGAPPHFPFK